MIRRLGPVTFALVALMPAVSLADGQGEQLMKRWAGADRCSQQAYRAFPDYTAESLAKRDQAFQQCLANGNLPPRDIPPPNKP
ncbi:MAG TPA: hypothetical protein VLX67_08185 [Stellaceae bacterium]|nr:hypothetical protein [Stellaceae bacterium]